MKTQPSGNILLRLAPEEHRNLLNEAQHQGLSLNRYLQTLIKGSAPKIGLEDDSGFILPQFRNRILPLLQDELKDALKGVLLFGSLARGQGHEHSDVDLLVVIDQATVIDRDLYRKFDQALRKVGLRNISVHFVPFPIELSDVGSLWFEAALEGIVIYLTDTKLLMFLASIKNEIAENRLQRQWSHGHPYWKKQS